METVSPLVGWDAIAKVTPYAADTLRKLYKDRMVESGVVWYRMVGRPWRRRPHAYVQDLMQFFSRG